VLLCQSWGLLALAFGLLTHYTLLLLLLLLLLWVLERPPPLAAT
jgi:hypothetical protein